jgi:aryl sulfotransferase
MMTQDPMEDEPATVVAPAAASYRGDLTTPERWTTWVPRKGDIMVCTPPKCGTTWTQSILAMLVHGGRDIPERISVLSPWVDAALGDTEEVASALARQPGRRVVKSHTPADGFPVWDGVTVVAVYRHPLDIFFSLRKHALNRKTAPDHPMRRPLDVALAGYLSSALDVEDFDRDTLATVAQHFRATVLNKRVPGLVLLHYADMISDRRGAVRRLAEGARIKADESLIEEIVNATGFEVMRAEAGRFVPEAGKGFWENDAAFFDSGTSEKWHGQLDDKALELYAARLAELIPDVRARRWLERGGKDAVMDFRPRSRQCSCHLVGMEQFEGSPATHVSAANDRSDV